MNKMGAMNAEEMKKLQRRFLTPESQAVPPFPAGGLPTPRGSRGRSLPTAPKRTAVPTSHAAAVKEAHFQEALHQGDFAAETAPRKSLDAEKLAKHDNMGTLKRVRCHTHWSRVRLLTWSIVQTV